jgi:hypothetical protein
VCPGCDHRVKGFTYCQECIVAGIERLQGNAHAPMAYAVPATTHKSPGLAVLLGLIPGLGMIYNGLIVRALVHFVVTAGLWTLEDVFDFMLFDLAGIGYWIYSMIDTARVANRLNCGEDLNVEEEKLKQILQEKTKIWGAGLIGLGALMTMHQMFSDRFMSWVFPVLLVGFGIMLWKISSRQISAAKTAPITKEFPSQLPPPPIFFDPTAQDYSSVETRRFDVG